MVIHRWHLLSISIMFVYTATTTSQNDGWWPLIIITDHCSYNSTVLLTESIFQNIHVLVLHSYYYYYYESHSNWNSTKYNMWTTIMTFVHEWWIIFMNSSFLLHLIENILVFSLIQINIYTHTLTHRMCKCILLVCNILQLAHIRFGKKSCRFFV